MELIRRLCIAEDHNKRPIEKFRAIYFDLIGEGVSGELRDVALQVKDV